VNWPGQERWLTLCQTAGANKAAARWYERLARAYDEPQRHYHNQQHIAECLWEFDQARSLARQPITVELALWFHDAVYDPKAGDNEEQSAALAKSCLREGGVSEALVETVSKLIMVTKHHEVNAYADAGLMVDIDLSILGREAKRFFQYEAQIRAEYAWVPEAVFAAKRAEILQGFLGRHRIYVTEWFHKKYERQARENLDASISNLKKAKR